MDRERSDEGWRAAVFAVALCAITLNRLQPLAHAAAMRHGNPSLAGLWTSMCQASVETGAPSTPAPAGKQHECCLGFTHAPVLAAPAAAFIVITPIITAFRFAPAIDARTPVGIRDGPNQPRAPPFPA